MGRVITDISVNGAKLYTMFDSGAENSYITESALRKIKLQPQSLSPSLNIALGGKEHTISQYANIQGTIEGNRFVAMAFIIPGLGVDWKTEKGIEFIFGAHDMQTWHIKIDVPNEKLDLSHFATEFVEF